MDPKIWGFSSWKFLLSIALTYPRKPDFQEIHNYKRFFTYLQYVLPCEQCRYNYANHLDRIPIDPYLTTRDHLVTWLTLVHNQTTSEQLKVPQMIDKYLGLGPQVQLPATEGFSSGPIPKTISITTLGLGLGLGLGLYWLWKNESS